MVIGITGGSGTGKSSLARLLGYEVIDADRVYHELLASSDRLRAELTAAFGTCERKDLAKIVFADRAELQKLNSITFPHIVAAIAGRIPPAGDVVIDAPLLFESGLGAWCDVTVAVVARRDVRIKRIMERDGMSSEQAGARVDAQKPDEFYIQNADHIIRADRDDLTDEAQMLKGKLFLHGMRGL